MFVKYAGRQRRLQPDAPRRHDRDPGRQPVGVRARHALDGPRGAGRQGLVRPRGAARASRCASPSRCGRATCSRARPTVTGKRDEGGEHLVDLDLTVANQDGVTAITGAATAAVVVRWDCSTVASRSSPARVAASGASSRSCFAREGASVVVNDVGVSLDGRGTEDDPAAQVCKEIEALGVEGGPELRLGHRLRRRGRHRRAPRSTRSARSTSS